MNNENWKIILEETQNEFFYKKSKSNLNIRFNRIAFIFFIFFLISIIYSIHLIHLGSRKSNIITETNLKKLNKNLYRADIIDRDGN